MNAVDVAGYVVRGIRADEWERVKELRLDALRDPAAPLAFLDTYENAVAKDDRFWRERAERAAEGATGGRQFVAEAADGGWVGSVTVLLEEPGSVDWSGVRVERLQGHVVGVYLRDGHRGVGLIQGLLAAAADWVWDQGAARVRLFVHEENTRAQRAYKRAGFVPTGLAVPFPTDETVSELEFALDR
ncbi:GNAT family N-acetyltransferase [Streptomyces sp. LaPpAH-108]|uniref:GNAT family N-acetyltransferase n=1 Tax=Streptomyces sp. LaPpAH-108 TaxID=1155714 RepID=UPI000D0AA8B6|nr:GNAT family N-acetyltransferase [Streptomyces sp. LaPpAH-108]